MPEPETRRIAIGNYETDRPWADTDLSDIEGYEDSHWYIVDLPAELVDAFEAARTELDRSLKALVEAAGFDPDRSRLSKVCGEYRGDMSLRHYLTGEAFWNDCKNCGWERKDHADVTPLNRGTDPALHAKSILYPKSADCTQSRRGVGHGAR